MNTKNLDLFVVDDDEAVRRSLGMLLLSRGYAVQVFESGESFLASPYIHRTGCLILDLRMDGMSGLEVLDAVRASGASLVTLFLSGHGDIPAAVKAMQNGAFDWLEKPCSDDVLIQKIQRALAYAEVLAQQKEELLAAQALWKKLTPREKTIARLVSDGKSSKIIARELEPIEPRTVDKHRGNIFTKLGVANSSGLGKFIRQYRL